MGFTPEQIGQTVRDIQATHSLNEAMNLAIGDEPWPAKGECLLTCDDPDIFVLEQRQTVAQAKAICAECTVIVPCLETALHFIDYVDVPQQVWGGTTDSERRVILRGRSTGTRQETYCH